MISNGLFLPIERSLIGTATTGQFGPKSNGNEEILYIIYGSRTEFLPLDTA